jgi:predicted dehydrogenase
MVKRTRYVLAGVGHRGLTFFANPLREEFGSYGELVGLFDISPERMQAVNRMWGTSLPTYTDYPAMLQELAPDAVIIATNDASHAGYVIQALEAGTRAICEKPLIVDADQARRVLRAAKKYTGRHGSLSLVTHSMRYDPAARQIKNIIDAGAIGPILRIHFQENLDRHHGADYFRRWHRFKANSGGLLVQKSSHDFDFLNWVVGSRPQKVIARGALRVYGKNGPFHSIRCTGCEHADECDYFADLDKWSEKDVGLQLYQLAEKTAGYFRDGCVYDERINIEDEVDILYEYENGIVVNYSLTAYASLESWRVELEGTNGRIVYEDIYPTDWPPGNYVVPGLEKYHARRLVLYSYRDGVIDLPTTSWMTDWDAELNIMLPELFTRPVHAPLTSNQATLEDGIWAVMIGVAANQSLENGSKLVNINSLLSDEGEV